LPKTVETSADINAQPLQIGIDAQGAVTINKNPVADLAVLESLLKAELVKNPEIGVHLYADQAVVYAKVAEAMAAIQHAGIAKLAFVTLEQ
jgi:biopolymer transport protein ExbD